jgi:predicted MFS family arabinose efflux permease
MGSEAAGLFGVIGAGGALVAPLAGKSADKRGPRAIVSLALVLYALGFVIFGVFSTSLLGLIAGVILLDIAVQATQISNQSRIYALIPEARSRINTVYMVIYFLGGAVGSACGAIAWRHFGWYGVSGFGLLTALVAAYSHRPWRAA